MKKKISIFLNNIINRAGYAVQKDRNLFSGFSRDGYTFDVVVDVGVADGTKGLFDIATNKTDVFLFEPGIYWNHKINNWIKKSNKGANVQLFNVALGSVKGEGYLNSTGRDAMIVPIGEKDKKITIVNSKSFFLKNKINLSSKKCIIKIDVEGFEEDVINGFEELIMEFDFVIVEVIFDLYNSDKFYKIVNYMYGKGFCVSSILACPRHSDDTNKTADFLFNNFNKKLS